MKRKKYTYDRILCMKCLNGNEQNITIIDNLAKQLSMIANLMDANVFIDCVKWDTREYMVVAEAIPDGKEPLYRECPVGEIALPENEPAVHRSVTQGMISRDILGKSQESFPIRQAVVPIFASNKKVIGVLLREYRVDSEQKLEFLKNVSSGIGDSLYSTWNLDDNIVKEMREAVLIIDQAETIIFCNHEAEKIFEKNNETTKLIGQKINEIGILKENFPELKGVCSVRVNNNEYEINYFYKDDNRYLCLIIHDITKECQMEKERRQQQFMLNEMNHRIKNNLQAIASFLNMQSYKTDDEKVKELFQESVNRVLAIGDVHNMLLNVENQKVDIILLTKKICINISQLSDMDYCIEGESIYIDGSKASIYGMVINELIQNSAKHTIPPKGMRKKIQICIYEGNENIYVDITDNGKGIPENFKEGMGISLVRKMVMERLDGSITFLTKECGSIASLYFLKT